MQISTSVEIIPTSVQKTVIVETHLVPTSVIAIPAIPATSVKQVGIQLKQSNILLDSRIKKKGLPITLTWSLRFKK